MRGLCACWWGWEEGPWWLSAPGRHGFWTRAFSRERQLEAHGGEKVQGPHWFRDAETCATEEDEARLGKTEPR